MGHGPMATSVDLWKFYRTVADLTAVLFAHLVCVLLFVDFVGTHLTSHFGHPPQHVMNNNKSERRKKNVHKQEITTDREY